MSVKEKEIIGFKIHIDIIWMLGEEILFNIKNQAHKVLGRCLNEQCQLS